MADVKLIINEQEIPLNPIMSKILANINLGFIEVLKETPEDKKEVNIKIIL